MQYFLYNHPNSITSILINPKLNLSLWYKYFLFVLEWIEMISQPKLRVYIAFDVDVESNIHE